MRATIIIPAPRFSTDLPVLNSLREYKDASQDYEVIVATGHNPSRQRNLAISQAKGEFIVFLDSDCILDANFFPQLEKHFSSGKYDVVGGPVLLSIGSPALQQLFQVTLSHPHIVGKTAARYSALGSFRATSEAELILCNLAVRRTLFQKFGSFLEKLYPNEENEWLDRIQTQTTLYYDPQLQVRRPQRESLGAFCHMLLRYGTGRTRQALFSRQRNVKQVLPLLLIGGLALFLAFPFQLLILSFLGSIIFALAIAVSAHSEKSFWFNLRVGFLGEVVIFFYALGQILGLGSGLIRRPAEETVQLYREDGQLIPIN